MILPTPFILKLNYDAIRQIRDPSVQITSRLYILGFDTSAYVGAATKKGEKYSLMDNTDNNQYVLNVTKENNRKTISKGDSQVRQISMI